MALQTANSYSEGLELPAALRINDEPFFRRTDLFWLLPFVAAVLFPVFWQLTSLPIRQWDEARLAVNAAEMLGNSNLIVTYFDGNPDMWNTKPPLQIWLLALSIKVFGYTEFAIRFPSAIMAIATMGLLFWFCLKMFKSKLVAVFSVMVLVSSQGFMGYHVARNGDYEAPLVFFISLYTLSFFVFLEKGKRKYFWICVVALTLAVLTKGVAGLMCAPALFLYAAIRGKLPLLLKLKDLYAGIAVFLIITLGYYFLRESLNPGYLKAVYENELGGRLLATLEAHNHPWNWYLKLMAEEKYTWLYLLPVCILVLLYSPSALTKRFTWLGILFITLYMVIISAAQTKLYWYDAPVYPIAALLIGLGLKEILQAVLKHASPHQTGLFVAVSVLLIIWHPYRNVLNKYLQDKSSVAEWASESLFGAHFRELEKNNPNQKEIVVLEPASRYNAALVFYKMGMSKKGYTINTINEEGLNYLKTGEVVVVCAPDLRQKLEQLFEVQPLHNYEGSLSCLILNKK